MFYGKCYCSDYFCSLPITPDLSLENEKHLKHLSMME